MLRSLSAMLVVTSALVAGQRPSFAGFRPIGFPDTPNRTTTPDSLADRFGEGTTERLPPEAHGDRDLIDRLSKLPIDKQPFWYINWQAYEAHRNKPQTFPQRPNGFIDSTSNTGSLNNNNQGIVNNNQAVPSSQGFSSNNNQAFSGNNQGFSNNNQPVLNDNQGFVNPNAGFSNNNAGFSNPNTGFVNPNNGLSTSNNGFFNPNTQYPVLPNSNPSNLNVNRGVPNLNPALTTTTAGSTYPTLVLTTTKTGSTNTNSGLTTSIPNGSKANSTFTSSSFGSAVAVNSRFAEVPTTNSNTDYSWNNSYQHSSFYRHSYNTSYYIPGDTKARY